jgi:lipopolysaccharide/colanic/teichoic acid biosynthesis glycosyltransferase
VNGRNTVSWEQKFAYDVEYVNNITFLGDVKIVWQTVVNVLKREGISQEGQATMTEFTGNKEQVTVNE